MKLFLFIPYIASLINGYTALNQNYNKATELPNSHSVITDLQQCCQRDFATNDFICTDQAINCHNNFCSSELISNKDGNNHINCCNTNLCDSSSFTQELLAEQKFVINRANTTYTTNNNIPVNQTINSDAIIGEMSDDISFSKDYLGKLCLHNTFFIDASKHIITLKSNNCNNKDISKQDIPFSISQPINKIVFLDTKQQIVNELLSSNEGVYSVNYAENKNLLFFISSNYVFIYKVDDNKQLTEVKRIYLQNKPVDISINHQENILAVANNNSVIFYNIAQDEQTVDITPVENTRINLLNIYRVQYKPTADTLLVETQTPDNLNTTVYNVENLNRLELIGIIPAQERKNNLTNVECAECIISLYATDVPDLDEPDHIQFSWNKGGEPYTDMYIVPMGTYMLNTTSRIYYNKWIISPKYNFMMKRRIILTCPPSTYGACQNSREEQYTAYSWNKQINKDDYSISYTNATNLDMFSNLIRSGCTLKVKSVNCQDFTNMTDILSVYDYFFSNGKNSVLALIGRENPIKWPHEQLSTSVNNRYLYFKKFTDINTSNAFKTILQELPTIVRHRLFDMAHTGVFNKDSSKLAIFSDNRMQVYTINLDSLILDAVINFKKK